MKPALLELLECPKCAGALSLEEARQHTGEVESARLACQQCGSGHAVAGSIPRFVPTANYADNFTMQWRRFSRTQLDSHSGVPISERRFFDQTGWDPSNLRGARVLDVGCGAGRFVEVALACGAEVVALDYSGAVDACWENHAFHPRLHVVQADVYALPFRDATFDYVYCFGVLQHTPDPAGAFASLPRPLRSNGLLAIDVYPKTGLEWLWPKYWLRPVTKRVDPDRLFRAVEAATPVLLRASRVVGSTPGIGRKLRYLVPVANYEGVYPLDSEQLVDWAVLDTFDMFGPAYDQPQTEATVRSWFEREGLADVEVLRLGHFVGRARKP